MDQNHYHQKIRLRNTAITCASSDYVFTGDRHMSSFYNLLVLTPGPSFELEIFNPIFICKAEAYGI